MSATWKNQLIPSEWQKTVVRSGALHCWMSRGSHGQAIDILSYRKWLHWHQLPESRSARPSRTHGTFVDDLGADPESQARKKNDLNVVCLNLANAYVSVPHKLIQFTVEFFHVLSSINTLVTSDFRDFLSCFFFFLLLFKHWECSIMCSFFTLESVWVTSAIFWSSATLSLFYSFFSYRQHIHCLSECWLLWPNLQLQSVHTVYVMSLAPTKFFNDALYSATVLSKHKQPETTYGEKMNLIKQYQYQSQEYAN